MSCNLLDNSNLNIKNLFIYDIQLCYSSSIFLNLLHIVEEELGKLNTVISFICIKLNRGIFSLLMICNNQFSLRNLRSLFKYKINMYKNINYSFESHFYINFINKVINKVIHKYNNNVQYKIHFRCKYFLNFLLKQDKVLTKKISALIYNLNNQTNCTIFTQHALALFKLFFPECSSNKNKCSNSYNQLPFKICTSIKNKNLVLTFTDKIFVLIKMIFFMLPIIIILFLFYIKYR